MLKFRTALMRAAQQGYHEGKLTGAECYCLMDIARRPIRFTNRKVLRKESALNLAEKVAQEKLKFHDPDGAVSGDIDWAHWIDLLIEWGPAIIRAVLLVLAFFEEPQNARGEKRRRPRDAGSDE